MRITVALSRVTMLLFALVLILGYQVYTLTNRVNNIENTVKQIDTNTTPKQTVSSYPVDEGLLDAIILVESNNNPNAFNKATGAVGLMQLTPIIYKNVCGLTKEQAFHPENNKQCGAKFLAQLLTRYKNNLDKSLYHYNNGYRGTNENYVPKVKKVLTNATLVEYSK